MPLHFINLSNKKSLENITYWKSEFYKHAPDEAPIIIARNKVDIQQGGDSKWNGDDDIQVCPFLTKTQ